MTADSRKPARIDRASPNDLTQLAADSGPAPLRAGAVLILDPAPGFNVAAASQQIAGRIAAVPRLRQRLCRAPLGCGRPFWADDPGFDPGYHIRELSCPPPGDERALLDLATAIAGNPMPWSRPLWSATFVTGLASGRTGLVIVMNHVLADGIGGLAVLASLVDEPPAADHPGAVPAAARTGDATARAAAPDPADFPAPAPSRRELAADAWAGRLRAVTRLPGTLRTIGRGLAELGATRPPRRIPPTSLNQPVGPDRRIEVVRADLAAVRDIGHAAGGTVNDYLAAITGALRTLLASRGEPLASVVISVPVSARHAATTGQLGNQVG